jgi:charged multivesicular body protein 6
MFVQEVSDMLGGQISNQDEDEVEDELEALEAEVTGVPLPAVPTTELPSEVKKQKQLARRLEREQRTAMLA